MSLFNNKLQKVQLGMLGQDVQDKFASTDVQLAQKAQQTDLDTANSRINTLVANAGNSSGNTEIVDIRTGTNGELYTSAGENVRKLGKSLTYHVPVNLFNPATVTADTSLNSSTGATVASTGNSVSDYVQILPSNIGKTITLYDANTLTVKKPIYFCAYDSNKTFISASAGYPSNFVIPANTRYIRFTIGTATITANPKLQLSYDSMVAFQAYFDPFYSIGQVDDNSIKTSSLQDGATTPAKTSFFNLYKSKNLFNKATVTTGYFLSYSTGNASANASFCYSDYIPVSANTAYVLNLTDGGIQACFYDANRNFLSGFNFTTQPFTFTTPTNCSFVRISIPTTRLDTAQMEQGATSTPYSSYFSQYKIPKSYQKGDIIVDINGNGDYTSLTDAVKHASDGDVIRVMSGLYDNEQVEAWGKQLYIIGDSRQDCIIRSHSGNYETPPIEMAEGLLKNLTIIAYNDGQTTGGTGASGWLPYAIHADDNSMYGKNFTVENCHVESQWNRGVGMGTRGSCHVLFKNSTLIGQAGGIFMHDAGNAGQSGVQNVSIQDCNIFTSNGSNILTLQTQEIAGSTMNVEFIRCLMRDQTNKASTTWGKYYQTSATTNPDDFKGLMGYRLKSTSWGNSLSDFNA